MTALRNNPLRAGQLAGKREFFGGWSRYAIAPIHTRFDAVEWFVWDADKIDPDTQRSTVIRQAATKEAAMSNLND